MCRSKFWREGYQRLDHVWLFYMGAFFSVSRSGQTKSCTPFSPLNTKKAQTVEPIRAAINNCQNPRIDSQQLQGHQPTLSWDGWWWWRRRRQRRRRRIIKVDRPILITNSETNSKCGTISFYFFWTSLAVKKTPDITLQLQRADGVARSAKLTSFSLWYLGKVVNISGICVAILIVWWCAAARSQSWPKSWMQSKRQWLLDITHLARPTRAECARGGWRRNRGPKARLIVWSNPFLRI